MNIRKVTPRWPFSVPDPPDELIKAARLGKLVPLVGAGISRQATTRDGEGLPAWGDFIKGLAQEALQHNKLTLDGLKQVEKLLASGKYLMVAEILREKLDDHYKRYLQRTFEIRLEPALIHKALGRLKTPLILTTNYDYLLEDTYGDRGRMRARTQNEAHLVQEDIQGWTEAKPPVIFKIHGSIGQPETIVLTERDYRDLLYNRSGYRTILSAILVTHTVLMLGFSFDDPELKQLFGFMREAFEYKSKTHYILLPGDNIAEIEREYNAKNFGVTTLAYQKSTDNHPEVLMFINKLIAEAYEQVVSTYNDRTNSSEPVQVRSVSPR